MPRQERRPANYSQTSFGRRRQAKRAQRFMEALEARRLLSTYTFIDQSTPQANATYLQGLIKGTTTISGATLTSGDTLQISPSDQFLFEIGNGNTNELFLPDRTDFAVGSAPITIETSDVGSLSGRLNPSTQESDLVQFLSNSVDSPAIGTSAGAHDFTFVGIEVAPYSDTNVVDADLVDLGTETSTQDTVASVPTDFIFNDCYIHGLDYNATHNNNYKKGILADSNFTTIENCYISDIHNVGQDCQAIGGSNGMGNFTITNNFLEASGENVMFGGGAEYVVNAQGVGQDPSNILITHNYFFKPLSWDQYSTQWDGNPYDVKNLLEFKHATDVTVNENLFQNCWVGADQVAEAIAIGPKQYGDNSWALVHDITVTNNVIENVGEGVLFAADVPTDGIQGSGLYTLPAYNIDVDNNLFEDVNQAGNGAGVAFIVTGGLNPGYNVTFSHNTIFSTNDFLTLGSSPGYVGAISTGFVFTDNVGLYAEYGVHSSAGDGTIGLNTGASGVTITNAGAGYTSAPIGTFTGGGSGATGTVLMVPAGTTNLVGGTGYSTNTAGFSVTFSGGGGQGATALAFANSSGVITSITITNPGAAYTSDPTMSFTKGGGTGASATTTMSVSYVNIDNNGTGYTSNPTITFTGGGYTTLATATAIETGGIVAGWTFAGNVIIGMPSSEVSVYPDSGSNTNSYDTSVQDGAGFLDTAGDEYGFLSTSAYYTDGTGGSTPGVNMANLSGITDFVPVDTTLQNYWKLDETSGTTATDVGLGTKHNGTLSSATIRTTSGEMNSGIALTGGTSGSVSVASFAADASFTFAAWIKPSSFSATQYIASTANNAFSFYVNTSGKLVATGATGTVTATSAIATGNWYLVSVTYSGGTLTLYNDGVSVGSATATTTSGSTTLYMGGNGGSVSSFNGTIDDVRYYSSALAESQLAWLYAGFGPVIGEISPQGSSTITTTTTNLDAYALGHADDIVQTGYVIAPPISFSWSEYSGPAGGVTFSANNSNAAQSTTATWTATGDYVLELTVTDGLGGSTSTLHPLTVNLGTTVPAVPTSVVATADTTDVGVALTWAESSTGSIDYNIQRATSSTGTWTTIASGITTTSWTDNSDNDTSYAPAANTTYYYEIQAYYNSADPSAWSASAHALTIPTAPTGLAAKPGTNTIALTWTADTNESSFTIQRSTDDANWSNVITGVSSTATSYTDTTPVSGVVYYYQIQAVNATGGSSYDGLPGNCGVATVHAYEGFNYPTAGTWNGGASSGVGFSGNWTVANSTDASIVSGLSYTSGSSALTTSGNALSLINGYSATETLGQSVGSSGTSIWVGFEFSAYNTNTTQNIDAEVDLNEVRMGGIGLSDVDARVTVGTNTYYLTTTKAITANTTYFVVYEIQYLTTGDIITEYEDPTPGTLPATATGSLTLPSSAQLSVNNALVVKSGATWTVSTFDEVRLGASYGSVAPDPKLTGGSGNSGDSPKRHPSQPSPFLAVVATPRDLTTKLSTQPTTVKQNHFYPAVDGATWQWADAASDVDSILLGTTFKNGLFN